MTYKQFNIYLQARVEVEDNRLKSDWVRTRWIATVLMQPHLGKGKKLNPTDLIEFDWEKKSKKIVKVDLEKQKEQAEKALKKYEKLSNGK